MKGLENAHELSESEQNLSANKLEIAQLPSQVEVPEGQLTNEKNSNHLKGEEEVTELKEKNEKSELRFVLHLIHFLFYPALLLYNIIQTLIIFFQT